MPITLFGAFRTDSTMTDAAAGFATTGSTFEISSYSQITISDGADGTIIDGDNLSNENPNDPTQTYFDNAIFWDYTIQVNDGTNTYQIGIVDYDINGSGGSGGVDAEDGFFIAFVGGSVPPLNTTLTFGPILDNGPSVDVDTLVPCFVAGTMIDTIDGPRPVETLCVGDQVLTLDNGPQCIRWIGSRTLNSEDLTVKPKLRPIRITADALGEGLPQRDLLVSRHHRMLVRSPIVKRMFGTNEILIPAHKLVDLPGIFVDENVQGVTYFHALFDNHEIVFAEDAPTESLFTGPMALKSVGEGAYEEILSLFPKISSPDYEPSLARCVPEKGKHISTLIRRHIQNEKALVALM